MKKTKLWLTRLAKYQKWLVIGVVLAAFCLRCWGLGKTPPSVYWDEMSLAYDAWSLARTAHDMHGNFLPLASLVSFGDYKPSAYFYATAIVMKLVGKRLWAVKVPSLLAGIAIVWLTGKLAGKMWPEMKKQYWWWELLVMILTAINPTFIHLSHIGFETNLATAFFLAGVYLLYPLPYRITDKLSSWWQDHFFGKKLKIDWSLIGGEVFLLLAFYTYHSLRVIAPLTGIYLLCWRWWREGGAKLTTSRHKNNKFDANCGAKVTQCLKKNWETLILMLVLAVVAVWPFVQSFGSPTLTNRFAETSIFADLDLISQSNQCRALGGDTLAARWWCHRFWYYGRAMLENFASHWRVNYLFVSGDANRRHSIGWWGVLYPLEIVAIFGCLLYASHNWRREKATWCWVIFWLLIGILPASMTKATPHLLRTLTVVPLWLILIGLGWCEWWQLCQKKWRWVLASVILLAYAVMFLSWLFYEHVYYPRAFASEWQDGYEEAIEELAQLQKQYPQLPVYVTRALGRPSVYYFWYQDVDPLLLQSVKDEQEYDQAEYVTFTPEHVSFGPGWSGKEQLFVVTIEELEQMAATPEAKIINNVAGQPVLAVGRYEMATRKIDND